MSFVNTIKKSQNLRRLFGKRELEIIEKQLLGIKLKNSEKTRLSRDIRKKFLAIKELSDYSFYFNLKKGILIKEMIENAKEVILESKYFSRIKRIVLFGSYAENQATFRSDVDIAVELSSIDAKESVRFRLDVISKVPEKIDIQVYNVLPEKIKKEIDEKGKIIWKKE